MSPFSRARGVLVVACLVGAAACTEPWEPPEWLKHLPPPPSCAGLLSQIPAEPVGRPVPDALAAGPPAPAGPVRATCLDHPDGFLPFALNERGQILGSRQLAGGQDVSRLDGATVTEVAPPEPDRWRRGHPAWSLNERGEVLGFTEDNTTVMPSTTPFVWSQGHLVDFGVPVHSTVWALGDGGHLLIETDEYAARSVPPDAPRGYWVWHEGRVFTPPAMPPLVRFNGRTINAEGTVTGEVVCDEPTTGRHSEGAIWRPGGAVTRLGMLGDLSTQGLYITDSGTVIGYATSPPDSRDFVMRPFVWRPGTGLIPVATDDPNNYLLGANDRGHLLVLDGNDIRLWRDGTFTTIGPFDGDERYYPLEINDRDQIILSHVAPPATDEALLWQDGRLIDLDGVAGGAGVSDAYDINDRGRIVGVVGDGTPGHPYHGVVWDAPH